VHEGGNTFSFRWWGGTSAKGGITQLGGPWKKTGGTAWGDLKDSLFSQKKLAGKKVGLVDRKAQKKAGGSNGKKFIRTKGCRKETSAGGVGTQKQPTCMGGEEPSIGEEEGREALH